MSCRFLAFSIVGAFVVVLFTTVPEAELCEMKEDRSLRTVILKIGANERAGVTRHMFTKCVSKSSGCSNCVPTGYELMNATYSVVGDSDDEVEKLVYTVTGCECVAKPPLNEVVKDELDKLGNSYMHEYRMMSYCTYALAAVCAVLGLIIIFMCLKYEVRCSKSKKKSETIGNDEQTRPLAVKQISQEENV